MGGPCRERPVPSPAARSLGSACQAVTIGMHTHTHVRTRAPQDYTGQLLDHADADQYHPVLFGGEGRDSDCGRDRDPLGT